MKEQVVAGKTRHIKEDSQFSFKRFLMKDRETGKVSVATIPITLNSLLRDFS